VEELFSQLRLYRVMRTMLAARASFAATGDESSVDRWK
jgi:hypothetical protein